ncbi:Ctr copper transporter family-domain-containing protein [Umbelopsis sp. PMI_123]|nr:Ctr copper transporter family-domain-containing protein [Umbelopsis sp. PMI_123]
MKYLWALAAVLSIGKVTADCISNPTDSSCSTYQMNSTLIQNGLNSLCSQMSYMPGCTVRNICANNTAVASNSWCNEFSILADICQMDMPNMSGCANYNQMCSNVSVVAECKTDTMLPGLPTTMVAAQYVQSICSSMAMDGCNTCVFPATGGFPQCDILSTYAKLCISMPDMDQCAAYKSMCQQTPSFSLCSSSSGSADTPPSMIMYFHTGFNEYILFKSWVPRNAQQYAGAWFAIFFITIFYQSLSVLRSNCEAYWLLNAQKDGGKFTLFGRNGYFAWKKTRIDLMRLAFTFVESTISYALMLITMTFNVGLFFAVVSGLAVGIFFFGRHRTLAGLADGGKLDGCASCQ